MSHYTELTLAGTFELQPTDLLTVRKNLPLDPGGFVPLNIRDHDFEIVRPRILNAGGGAINLTLGVPFGFVARGREGALLRSQHTSELVLQPSEERPDKWTACLLTAGPLSRHDAILFSHGIRIYATHVEGQLSRLPRSTK